MGIIEHKLRVTHRSLMTNSKDDLAHLVLQLMDQNATLQDDLESVTKRCVSALDELRCPECGCRDEIDAESSECGCDAPICSRTVDEGTLAESWVRLKRQNQIDLEVARGFTPNVNSVGDMAVIVSGVIGAARDGLRDAVNLIRHLGGNPGFQEKVLRRIDERLPLHGEQE